MKTEGVRFPGRQPQEAVGYCRLLLKCFIYLGPTADNSSLLPKVSCIVLSYNAGERIDRCVRSILESDYPNLEVLIVDNASQDNTLEVLANFPEIRVIRNEENAGFAAGNNIGIRASTGDFVFLLNDDATIDGQCVKEMVKAALADPLTGVLGGKVYTGGTNIIQSVGGRILDSAGTPPIGHGEVDSGQYDVGREVDYVVGCAFFISRRALKEVGLLSEAYFFYGEEVEYCLRVGRAGLHVKYVPGARVHHYVGSFAERQTFVRFYNACRSRLVFAFRNFEGIRLMKFMAYEFVLGPTGVILGLRVSGGWKFLPLYWRATFRGYRWFGNNAKSIMTTKRTVPRLA